MKEVKFREYRQTGAFICGVFILLCFTVLILIFLTEPPANTRIDVILYCFLILILFLTIGISCIYFSFLPKIGIKSIRIDDTTMIITSYDENKKEVIYS